MNIGRREFLTGSLIGAGSLALSALLQPARAKEFEKVFSKIAKLPSDQAASDDDFWAWVQQQYTATGNIINFNNGGVNPQPKVVQEAFERFNRLSNEAPSYYMWQILDQGREPLRKELAALGGCSFDEIAIDRNSTEALETVIFGLPLKEGDEVVLCKQDYPNMINAWKQREKRNKIKLVWVSMDLPSEDDDYMVSTFEKAFTEKTKIVQVTHMINWVGQMLPARKIADAAHKRDIEVILDSAQTFAHIEFNIPDTGCDYFGTSLHKWLGAPFGTGMLYIKKDKISKIWPLFAHPEPESENIRKFEALGTRSFPAEQAIGQAIKFHNLIGSKRKEERFRYLKNYWMEQVKDIPKVKLNTSLKAKYSCGLGHFSIEGKEPGEIVTTLFKKHGIHSTAIVWENISGVRITPNLYNTTHELDILIKAIKEMAGS
jgi:selenocysteine lyase/cysteine desulfurase